MPSKPRRCLHDILDNIARIRSYEAEVGGDLERPMLVDAVVRCIERISQSANELRDLRDAGLYDVEAYAPEHNWRQLRGMGDRMRHRYEDVDMHIIWQSIELDFPVLEDACRRALQELPPDPDRQ